MPILIVIAARGGSRGLPGKNVRLLAGLPLIAHTIAQARTWGAAEHVVVTTDSPQIAEIARAHGAEVPFLRPAEMATDAASKFPALRHALLQVEGIHKKTFETIVDLDPTAPLRTTQDLDNCLAQFRGQRLTALFSVTRAHKNPYFNLVELSPNGVPTLSKGMPGQVLSRQQAPPVFAINGSIYVYSREHLLNGPETCLTANSGVYVMPDTAGVDVDREVDFLFLEFLVKEGLWTFTN